MDVWEDMKLVFFRAYPKEAVVAVAADMTWRELQNVAGDPLNGFALTDADKLALEKNPPFALIHSHPNGTAAPSDLDSASQLATGWTWGIVAIHGNPLGEVYSISYPEFWGDDVPIPPLEGRPYLWGIRDCYSLIRDFYRLEGKYLRDIPRARYPDHYPVGHWGRAPFPYWIPKLGFKPINRNERKRGDMFTMKVRTPHANHCGIYLGDGKYIHQPLDRNSEIDFFNERQMERESVQFYRR